MFKRGNQKSKEVEAKKPVEPQKTLAEIEAEKAISRGQRIKSLADEAKMWRDFAGGCRAGRQVWEEMRYMYMPGMEAPPRLNVYMDEDTAPMWVAFARQMAEERERRLKDILGV